MALGYCPVCDTLRSIRPGPQKWGSRERTWYPVPHEYDMHVECGQVVEAGQCRACGPTEDIRKEPCTGDKRAIK